MSHEVAGAANAFFVKTSAQLIALCGNMPEQFDPIGTAWDKPTTCFRLRTAKARTNSIANRCTLLWFMRNSAPRLTAFSNRVSTIKPRAPVLLGICPGHLLARLASCGRHRARTFCCRPGRPSWKAPATFERWYPGLADDWAGHAAAGLSTPRILMLYLSRDTR
jgi:hypothetical protein